MDHTHYISAWRRLRQFSIVASVAVVFFAPTTLAQQSSISAWEAAEFRIWGFVPDWTPQSQVTSFSTDGVYDHVSDVLYFGGVRPTASGNLVTTSAGVQHLVKLKSHAAAHDFNLHMSMFTVSGGSVDSVWNSIVGNASNRANFVSNVVNLMNANNMTGFNLDWERPNTVTEWGNYTQLAKDLKAAIGPDREVSVDDFGFPDSDWDNSPVFDARTYDQLFIMGYHYPADNGTNLDHQSFADFRLAMDDQGAEKAFVNEQLVPGIGTWGNNGPTTVSLKNIVAANPNLPGDATSYTGTVVDLGGTPRTGTWDIESRYGVRDKVQLALDRNMPGVMSWTLHYDATNQMSLHRVAHHYAMFKRQIPDVNLDGVVDAADAHVLADNMGTVPGWTGTSTDAWFENFYIRGNWEQGDRNGNGFVNQFDADWLADRFASLDVALPDRLAYTGTFENFADGRGLVGRWEAGRDASDNLDETGNFQQLTPGALSFTATGVGGSKRSSAAVTIRNQNAAERFDTLNTDPRKLSVEVESPIDLSDSQTTYFTMLVRQNTASLLSNHISSNDRTLSLQFLDGAGENQFDFSFHGLQQQFSIRSQADTAGDDVVADGFGENATYLLVGKIAGNGAGANTLQASLLPSGAAIGNFAADDFAWMLTAEGSTGFNPRITQLQIESLYEASYTVSNVWIGTAAELFALPAAAVGDFNGDGIVNLADYTVWRDNLGQTGDQLPADANGNGTVDTADYTVWKANFGTAVPPAASLVASIPEPSAAVLLLGSVLTVICRLAVG